MLGGKLLLPQVFLLYIDDDVPEAHLCELSEIFGVWVFEPQSLVPVIPDQGDPIFCLEDQLPIGGLPEGIIITQPSPHLLNQVARNLLPKA